MTNNKTLSKETRDELERAAEEIENEKERKARQKRRENTEYGHLLPDEDDEDNDE